METIVFLERNLFGSKIRQNSKTNFFCANDLVAAGNQYRAANKMKLFDFRSWMDSKSNKEFFEEMEAQYGKCIVATKGKNGATWVHPFIFIDLALSIDPKLKIEAYSWIHDELVKARNNSGDSYKLMCGALYENCSNKAKFHRGVSNTAILIQKACGVVDWNKATESQLKKRDKIHENITLLASVLRDNNQAIRIGIEKVINN